jgi:NADPH-dependent curcumin reductase CurA
VTNRRITLATRPRGFPQESDFELVETPVPEPGPGEVLVRTRWLSLDPYMRGRMSTARSYAPPVELGDVMTGQGVAEVVASNASGYSPGELVVAGTGWQEYAALPAGALRRVDPRLQPPSLALHAVGMTGLTAYFGLFDVCRPVPGDTIVVSAASGAVGQVVGQLAKLAGCRTVGLAGGPEKVADLSGYGYDVGIDYRAGDVGAAISAACPDGVDIYFDNVGGPLTDAVMQRLALHARIAICGQISQYNLPEPELGPRNLILLIVARARIEGFLVSDYATRWGDALRRLAALVAEGRLRYREDVTDGLEHAPRAFIGLLRGENRGKALVRLSD